MVDMLIAEPKSDSYLLIPMADIFRNERYSHVRYLGELINIRNAVRIYVVNATDVTDLGPALHREKQRLLNMVAGEKEESGYTAHLQRQAAMFERLASNLHDRSHTYAPHDDIIRIVAKDLKRSLEASDLVYMSWSAGHSDIPDRILS